MIARLHPLNPSCKQLVHSTTQAREDLAAALLAQRAVCLAPPGIKELPQANCPECGGYVWIDTAGRFPIEGQCGFCRLIWSVE